MVIRVIDLRIIEWDMYDVTVMTADGDTVRYKKIKKNGIMPDDTEIDSVYVGKTIEVCLDTISEIDGASSYMVQINETDELTRVDRIYLTYDADGELTTRGLGADYDRKMYRYALEIFAGHEELIGYIPDLLRWLNDNDQSEEVLRL